MKLGHQMPFGAQLAGDGTVRFRLWAPTAMRVDLCLENAESPETLAMSPVADGWFEHVARAAAAGTRYCFRVNGELNVPDPASRFNPRDVHGSSEVVNPAAYEWGNAEWRGRPWHEAVIYELHVGSFTPEGTFRAVAERLPYLRKLGITVVELMPVADFFGTRNWGYDGVLPFAPDSRYGRPEDLKYLVDRAHHHGLMVMLDVVYNHFGPEGNYLHAYAEHFFSQQHHTPWGAAINFDSTGSRNVRDFVIHNALYWLEEFRFDGLRLDAVHAIKDDSRPDILVELAEAVRRGPGRARHVHLVLENDDNAAHFLERVDGRAQWYDAQWNDDYHHAAHVLLTGERDGYYADYASEPARSLARTLAEGYAYQGEHSQLRGHARGESSRHLPATAFVAFLQNHDQVGNRALGERLSRLTSPDRLQLALALLLLGPSIPLLFMGEEFGCEQPFPFFCDFEGDLARAVTEGRRNEFKAFARFQDEQARRNIPDPNALDTFVSARIDWTLAESGEHVALREWVSRLLRLRQERVVPLLADLVPGGGEFSLFGAGAMTVQWRLAGSGSLLLAANFGEEEAEVPAWAGSEVIYAYPERPAEDVAVTRLGPRSLVWRVRAGGPS